MNNNLTQEVKKILKSSAVLSPKNESHAGIPRTCDVGNNESQ